MSLEDAKARFYTRLAPNAPQLALNDSTVLMSIAQALLAEAEDVRTLATNIAPTLFVATATGDDLKRRAADYGVPIGTGAYASGYGVFKTAAGAAPPPAATSLTYQAGTVVGTAGDGITSPLVLFVTGAAATISSGAGVSIAVPITAQTVGVVGNVNAGSITIIQTQGASGVFSNATADGGTATTGGNDPDSDATIRNNIYKALYPRYGSAAIEAAILAVAGVYDAYVYDPAAPANGGASTGGITYYWCDVNGNQPTAGTQATATTTITGGAVSGVTIITAGTGYAVVNNILPAVVFSAPPSGVTAQGVTVVSPTGTITGVTITNAGSGYTSAPTATITTPGLPYAVQVAVASVLPPGVTATGAAFTVVNLSNVAVTYSAPAALQTSTLTPQIQAAVAAYVQGNGAPRSGMTHNSAPNAFAMGSSVQTGVNAQTLVALGVPAVPSLTYFVVTATTPAIGAAGATTIYRLNGVPSSVVTLTRQ